MWDIGEDERLPSPPVPGIDGVGMRGDQVLDRRDVGQAVGVVNPPS
jgi:hypothetical protein